jgi:tetratricopeptide (TPR) repeat protein
MQDRTPAEEATLAQSIWEAADIALLGRPRDAAAKLAGNPAILSHHAGLNHLGSLYLQIGSFQKALESFDRAVALSPTSTQAHCNRGPPLQALGRNQEALAAYDTAIQYEPTNDTAILNRGILLNLMGRPADAVAAFDRALQLNPKLSAARLNRGLVRLSLGDFAPALSDFERALLTNPDDTTAQKGRLTALQGLGRRPTPMLLRPTGAATPRGVENLISRANVLAAMQRYDQALSVIAHLHARKGPTGASLENTRSAILWRLGRKAEAIAAGRRAVALDPGNDRFREFFGMLCLKVGDFQTGWQEFEHRLAGPHARLRVTMQTAPAWTGEDLAEKRIVVLAEQGHGDTLQFIRYLLPLQQRGGRIAAVVQRPLLRLLRSMLVQVDWSDAQDPNEKYDYYLHLVSLPHVFGTRMETIPATTAYLAASSELIDKWRNRVGTGGFRVGLAWQGNPAFPEDYLRSVPLAAFEPLALPGVRMISLQAVRGVGQMQNLPPDMIVEDLGGDISNNPNGFSEIAGLMMSLDLVVTSDTAIAHLAGALGRPVWVALSSDPDWRWLQDRADSPWFPTMRLFRQKTPGDWAGVFREMRDVLVDRLGG